MRFISKFVLVGMLSLIVSMPTAFSQGQGNDEHALSLREKINDIFDLERSLVLEGHNFSEPRLTRNEVKVNLIAPTLLGFFPLDEIYEEGLIRGRVVNFFLSFLDARDQWFGEENLDFDRDAFFRMWVVDSLWKTFNEQYGISDIFEAFRKEWKISPQDPDVNPYLLTYLMHRFTVIRPLHELAAAEGLEMKDLWEVFYKEAEEAVRKVLEAYQNLKESQHEMGRFLLQTALENREKRIADRLHAERSTPKAPTSSETEPAKKARYTLRTQKSHVLDAVRQLQGQVKNFDALSLEAQVALVTQSLTARGIVQNDPEKGSLSKDTVRRHVSALRAVESKLGNVSDPQALAVFTVWQIARYDQDLLNVTAEKRPAALKQKLQDLYFLPDNDSTLREEVLVLLTDADVLESQMTLRSAEELMVLSGVYGALNEDTVRFLADEFYGKKAEHRIQSLVHRFGTQPFSLKEQVELIRMAQDFLRERSLLFYHLPLQTQARLILKYLSRVGFIWTETQVPFTQVTSLLDLSQKMVGQYYLPANFHEEALVQHVWVYGVSQFKLHEASDEARVQEIFKAMAGKFSTISEPQVLFLFDELLSRHVQPVLGGYALPFDTATQLAVLSRHYVATLNAMREEFSGSIGTDLSPIRERVNQIFDAELEVMKRAPHNIFNRISLRSRARLITTYLGLKYGYEEKFPERNWSGTPRMTMVESMLRIRDAWLGDDHRYDFNRDSFFRAWAVDAIQGARHLDTQNVDALMENLKNQWGIFLGDPDFTRPMLYYLHGKLGLLNPTRMDRRRNPSDLKSLLEAFHIEAESFVRSVMTDPVSSQNPYPIIDQVLARIKGFEASIEAVIDASKKVPGSSDEIFVGHLLQDTILDGLSVTVTAKLMKGHGGTREFSAADRDFIIRLVQESLSEEFRVSQMALDPDVTLNEIQLLPEKVLTWSNAQIFLRNVCEKGLKRIR
ncbi:MAG: hypothetical protein A3B70_07090 [Deltaproteobacteria bacterium RIFCSPHIGHO2_02_FULL_40_11]|nr:MAG: hypothetical protein A3B70_07090 [Deltaproteobacteria bacterium RIFCSPHIGHO2_02_FULL_40_11]